MLDMLKYNDQTQLWSEEKVSAGETRPAAVRWADLPDCRRWKFF
jgi:hypothetical protein